MPKYERTSLTPLCRDVNRISSVLTMRRIRHAAARQLNGGPETPFPEDSLLMYARGPRDAHADRNRVNGRQMAHTRNTWMKRLPGAWPVVPGPNKDSVEPFNYLTQPRRSVRLRGRMKVLGR